MNSILKLDDSLVIGEGLHRVCYRHPQREDRCIKINIDDSERSLKETERELQYYNLMEKRDAFEPLKPIVPAFHGAVHTSAGDGYVFDLVRDHDGEISKPLTVYMSDKSLRARYGEEIRKAYRMFRRHALDGNLVTMAMKPYNMLLQIRGDNDFRLVVIDNLGTANFIPVAYLSRILARMKLKRHLERFERLMHERCDFKIY